MNHLSHLLYLFFVFTPILLHGEERITLNARSMTYVLQAEKLASSRNEAVKRLASSGRDLIVLDYAYNTDINGLWTSEEIESIRKGKFARKVVAYISIGEAENYRPYWQSHWDTNQDGQPDKGAPSFLNTLNPDWEGNYKVRYWHRSWQNIILKYVDEIMKQGFDGIYLDIVDAFEFYEYDAKNKKWVDNRINPATGNTYRQDMIAWVRKIALHVRKTKPHFLIIPQNAAQLLTEPEYVNSIDSISIEDLFTTGNKKQKQDHIEGMIRFLKNIQRVRKPVFLIEYGKKKDLREFSAKNANLNEMFLLFTNRNLSILGTSASEN